MHREGSDRHGIVIVIVIIVIPIVGNHTVGSKGDSRAFSPICRSCTTNGDGFKSV